MASSIKYLFIFALLLCACGQEETNTLSGTWKLVKYHDLAAGTSMFEPTNLPQPIIMQFVDNGFEGTIEGHTVTNSVSGTYELLEGNKIKILSLFSTDVAEPSWGDKFGDAMGKSSSYERKKDKLFIYFNDDAERMEFEKE